MFGVREIVTLMLFPPVWQPSRGVLDNNATVALSVLPDTLNRRVIEDEVSSHSTLTVSVALCVSVPPRLTDAMTPTMLAATSSGTRVMIDCSCVNTSELSGSKIPKHPTLARCVAPDEAGLIELSNPSISCSLLRAV